MMKKIIYIIIFFLTFSCGLGPRKLKGFTVYKYPISKNNENFSIRTDGIYVSTKIPENKSETLINGFYLYKNGNSHPELLDRNFWLNPENEILSNNFYLSKNFKIIDIYKVSNDTITIQGFGSNNNEFYSKWVIEDKYIILNDTTLEKISSYSYLRKQELLEEPMIFKFYPTNKKPDSTKAWFIDKKWYREGLHESRQ